MIGRPKPELVSTSYVESLHMTTRQNCRRFTRLTNAHNKSAVNHAHAVALNFFVHNFIKVHTTLTELGRQDDPGDGGRAHGPGFGPSPIWSPGSTRNLLRSDRPSPVPRSCVDIGS